MIQGDRKLRCSYLSLIEMLVAMTALLLIMAFLMTLISKVNQLAVVQRNQTDMYEKQRLFFDIVSRDLHGMVATDAEDAEINYRFDTTAVAFVTSSGLGVQPDDTVVLQEIVYWYNPTDSTIYRFYTPGDAPEYDFLGDTNVYDGGAGWGESYADSSVFLTGVDSMTFYAYSADAALITPGINRDTAVPAYVDVQLLMSNTDRESSDSFAKRIYLKRGY